MLSKDIKQNEQYRNEVLEAVDGLADDKLNKRPDSDSWTIMQVLDHLYLIEQGITKAIASELKNTDSEKLACSQLKKQPIAPIKKSHLILRALRMSIGRFSK